MSSTTSVNFSVRQNKAIERQIVIDGMSQILTACSVRNAMYVGLGSVWFTDFAMVHRSLGVTDMHSIEMDPVIASRARYNRPFRTVRVHEGASDDVLPELLMRKTYLKRPWIVWLDYEHVLRRDHVLEFNRLLRDLPENSFLLTTFSAQPSRYGKLAERAKVLGEVFGYELDPQPSAADMREGDALMMLMGQLVEDHLRSASIRQGRFGGYVPAFKIGYKDGSPMTTVGGFLPSADRVRDARQLTESRDWSGRPDRPIATAPLTAREVAALQSKLPCMRALTRTDVNRLGFDLEDDQISLFEEHYLRYPAFAQIAL